MRDNLARVNSLATTTAKGLRTLSNRVEDDENYVMRLQQATAQKFRSMDDRATQLEIEMRRFKLQLAVAVVMIMALLLWRSPHVLANAMAFCKEVLGLPVTSPLTAPADAPNAVPRPTTPQQNTKTATAPSSCSQ